MSDRKENQHLIFATVPEWHVLAVTIQPDTVMTTFCPACTMPYKGEPGQNLYGKGIQCQECGARWMCTWSRTEGMFSNQVYDRLFRSFLLESGYRDQSVRSKNIAVDFNIWLEKKHTRARVDGRKMARILKKWGAGNSSRPFASTFWAVGEKQVCNHCGGHVTQVTFIPAEYRCDNCERELVPSEEPKERVIRETPSDSRTGSLTDYF